PRFTNGVRYFYARVFARDAQGASVQGQQVLLSTAHNFKNLDGWAIVHNLPARTAQGTAMPNLNWYGGPGAAGQGNYTIVPVIYTPGRSVQTATTSINALAGSTDGTGPIAIGAGVNFCGPIVFTTGVNALPWRTTY